MRSDHEHGRGLERSLVKCNSFSMSEGKEEQVHLIKEKKRQKLLLVFCMDFQMVLLWNWLGGLRVKSFFFKEKPLGKRYRCVVAMVKEYICLGGGYTGKGIDVCVCARTNRQCNVVSWFWAGKCSCDT